MNTMTKQTSIIRKLALLCALAGGLAALLLLSLGRRAAPIAAQGGPDLVIGYIEVDPPNPHTTTPSTITIQVRNQGDTNVFSGLYLYIDPEDDPPTATTPETWPWPSIPVNAGGNTYASISDSDSILDTSGCDHTIYAWVDRDDAIAEIDETNNVFSITVCVEDEPDPVADEYEDDDTCADATSISTDGTPQVHNLNPVGDVDWVRFQGTAGITYTISAVATGAEAEPTIFLNNSCQPPGGAFGRSSQIVFLCPADGTYYVRTQHHQATYGDETAYELSVLASGEIITGPQPIVLEIGPDEGPNDRNTNATITGTQFVFPPLARLCPADGAAECYQLLDTAWVNANKLLAIVSANVPEGDYDLVVTNPGGRKGQLDNAFTVQPAAPVLDSLLPARGYNDVPNDLSIYGFNFADDATVQLDGVDLEGVKTTQRTYLRGTVPAGVNSGVYTLTVTNEGGGSATLSNGYVVLDAQDDLYGEAHELWVDPVAPQVGDPALVGLIVHRKGGTDVITNVVVGFTIGITPLAQMANVEDLASGSVQNSTGVTWTPDVTGDYTIIATIDPAGEVPEVNKANNVVSCTVTVLPSTEDTDVPKVGNLEINDGKTGTADPNVTLNITATDAIGESDSEVAQVRYVELEYSQGSGVWLPVQDSGWVDYNSARENFPWSLRPVGGMKYIQAWVKDGAGNISLYPHQQRIDYLPPTEQVAQGQTRIYRREVITGQHVVVTVTPEQGDPDLYIWSPDWWEGRSSWVSNQASGEECLDVVAPVSGTYQIEVYGYDTANYSITLGVNSATGQLNDVGTCGGVTQDKPQPTAPVVAVESEPCAGSFCIMRHYHPSALFQHKVYLPLILKNHSGLTQIHRKFSPRRHE